MVTEILSYKIYGLETHLSQIFSVKVLMMTEILSKTSHSKFGRLLWHWSNIPHISNVSVKVLMVKEILSKISH